MHQVNATGPGYVTYQLSPTQPLAAGAYTVAAKYTPTANYASASSSSPYAFTVNPAVTSPPPTSEPTSQHHQASSGAQKNEQALFQPKRTLRVIKKEHFLQM